MSASYRPVCNGGWKTTILIEMDTGFLPAYEVHEFPGVIRFEEDHQPVPLDLCQKIGWKDLAAQRAAIQKQNSAYQTLMNM